MKTNLFIPLLLTACALLNGCTTPPTYKTAYLDPKHRDRVKTIGFIELGGPNIATVERPGGMIVGSALGGIIPVIVGGSVSIVQSKNATDQFNKSAQETAPTDYKALIVQRVTEGLEKSGYTVKHVPTKKPNRHTLHKKSELAAMNAGVDAYLDVVETVGYYKLFGPLKNFMGEGFVPRALLAVNLTTADGKEVLLDRTFANFDFGTGTLDGISPQHRFATMEDLTANGPKAIEGLNIAVARVTDRLARSLTLYPCNLYVVVHDFDPASSQFTVPYSLSVRVDDDESVSAPATHCDFQTIAPGKHVIKAFQQGAIAGIYAPGKVADPVTVEFEAVEGRDYFFEAKWITNKSASGPEVSLVQLPDNQGRAIVESIRAPRTKPTTPDRRP